MSQAEEYKGIEFDSMIVDNASMQLVSRPQQFSNGILLMPNLYGNIISNIACGLVGGPGLVSGMNLGDKYAVFETVSLIFECKTENVDINIQVTTLIDKLGSPTSK